MYEASNVTGTKVTWQPTAYLRVRQRKHGLDIEQLWINYATKAEEWRPLPVVDKNGLPVVED